MPVSVPALETVSVSEVSTSLSLVRTLPVTATPSSVAAFESSTTTGASLAPVIAMTSDEATVASPSATSILKVSVNVSGVSIVSSVTT